MCVCVGGSGETVSEKEISRRIFVLFFFGGVLIEEAS